MVDFENVSDASETVCAGCWVLNELVYNDSPPSVEARVRYGGVEWRSARKAKDARC